jgi:uncharacterized membrane protein (DUF2068 family)
MIAAETQTPESRPKRAPTLYVIAGIKLAKGLILVLVALGIFALVGKDLQTDFEQLVRGFGLDPEWRFFAGIGDKLDRITPANVRWVGIVTALYSLISLVESVGLVFRVSWAGWLAIGDAAFFIPIELHELTVRPHWFVLAVLAFNVLIVWYLLVNRRRLFRHHHH